MKYETELNYGDIFYALDKGELKIKKCRVDEVRIVENGWDTLVMYKHYDRDNDNDPYEGTLYDQDEVFMSKKALLEHLDNSCDE